MKNLNLNCPIGGTGYGITSLNIFKALSNLDINIALFPIGQSMELNNSNEKPFIDKALHNAAFFDKNAPCLKIWHQNDLANRIGNGHFYAFPFFEVDKLNAREIHHLNYCDYIFVASEWGKKVLLNNGINKKIYVAPLAVDLDIFKIPIKIKIQNPNYIFFHIGKWEYRKSHDFLIKAFDTAFDHNDNVELRLVPHNPFLNEAETTQWMSLVSTAKLANKIKVFNRLPTQYHLAEFISQGDCGVFLSRAEGWNNEILESMALNKPIIATNYSAHTEYCDEKNCYLVGIDELEIADDKRWFFGEGSWAKLGQNQLEQTVNYMRYVYDNRISSNPNGVESAAKFNWNNTASIISGTLLRNNSYHANTKKKIKRR
jgi:glycosyltransferase involved in cell wall biosynthesis